MDKLFKNKSFIIFQFIFLLRDSENDLLTLGRTRWKVHATPFLSFVLQDKTSAPDVFSGCSFISRAHFESSSVTVSFYGYEI